MINLLPGMIILTEGDRESFISIGVRLATGSWWTHAFMVLSNDVGIEAWVPKVRYLSVSERLAELRREGRGFIVLDYPGVTTGQRFALETRAHKYHGRLYDYAQIAVYVLTGRFIKDGPKRIVCSRLLENIFTENKMPLSEDKFLAPADLLDTRLVRIWEE